MKPVLLFDMSYMMRRSFAAGRNLSYNNQPTGLVYNFMRSVTTELKKFQPEKYLFVADAPPYIRSSIAPCYKAQRDQPASAYKVQASAIRKLFSANTTCVIQKQGYEADDIIAQYCLQYPSISFIIITTDKDMYQCITDKVSVYNPQSKKMWNLETFRSEYGIDPSMWLHVKAIIGDTSDNLKGIHGVQIKTALKYLNGTCSAAARTKIEDATEQTATNMQLMQLPFHAIKVPALTEISFLFNIKTLTDFYTQYGFTSFIKKIEQHVTLLNNL